MPIRVSFATVRRDSPAACVLTVSLESAVDQTDRSDCSSLFSSESHLFRSEYLCHDVERTGIADDANLSEFDLAVSLSRDQSNQFEFRLPSVIFHHVRHSHAYQISSVSTFSSRFRQPTGNAYQVTADVSFPGNITSAQISAILTPILTNLPPQFNVTYVDTGSLDPDEIQQINRE